MSTALVSPDGQTPFVSGNLIPASTLTSWMQSAIGSPTATASQWNYAMDHNIVGGFKGPDVDLGWGDSRITAEAYLSGIRAWQQPGQVAPVVAAGGFPLSGAPGNAATASPSVATQAAATPTGKSLMVPIIIGAAILGLLWYLKSQGKL